MKASISFPELQSILQQKTEQNFSFSSVDEKTVHMIYHWGIIKKSADLSIINIDGSDLLVKFDAGSGTDSILSIVLSLFKKNIPEGLIEKLPDRQLLLHLGKIEQVKNVFDAIQVDDIHVLANELEVEGRLK